MPPRLYLNHLADRDCLIALQFGLVDDGQPPEHWRAVSKDFEWFEPEGVTVGFRVRRFSSFDPDARAVGAIWKGRGFCAPTLGLGEASAGEIVTAARPFFGGNSSINRSFYEQASVRSGEDALPFWLACLQSGDATAHYGLGCTLHELGRYQEAYRHLRHYTEISPNGSWNWCWYGKAAQSLGLWKEARHAYEIAIELEDDGGEPTEARDLLAGLE